MSTLDRVFFLARVDACVLAPSAKPPQTTAHMGQSQSSASVETLSYLPTRNPVTRRVAAGDSKMQNRDDSLREKQRVATLKRGGGAGGTTVVSLPPQQPSPPPPPRLASGADALSLILVCLSVGNAATSVLFAVPPSIWDVRVPLAGPASASSVGQGGEEEVPLVVLLLLPFVVGFVFQTAASILSFCSHHDHARLAPRCAVAVELDVLLSFPVLASLSSLVPRVTRTFDLLSAGGLALSCLLLVPPSPWTAAAPMPRTCRHILGRREAVTPFLPFAALVFCLTDLQTYGPEEAHTGTVLSCLLGSFLLWQAAVDTLVSEARMRCCLVSVALFASKVGVCLAARVELGR